MWLAFFMVSVWPIISGLYVVNDAGFGDVSLYYEWSRNGIEHGIWPVINEPWVYPLGALAPMALLAPIGDLGNYFMAWWALIFVLNAVTLIVIRDGLTNGYRAAWWWLAFLLLLGPAGMSRIDAVAAALATIALVLIGRRPRSATILITLAGWVKVAHFAWLLPLLIVSSRRIRNVLVPSALISAVVFGFGLSLGSGVRILGFLTQQSDRNLQSESVFATPLSVSRIWGAADGYGLNLKLNTWEYSGNMATHIAQALDPMLVIVALLVSLLVFRANRRTRISPTELIALATFAMTLVLIVFNKVGSPQFALWLAGPLVLSFASSSSGSVPAIEWRFPLATSLVVAAMTQVVYPLGYHAYLYGSPSVIIVGAVRNLLVVALLVWAIQKLWSASHVEHDKRQKLMRHSGTN